MFRNKGWFGSGMSRPKNPHSLEHLKYLYNVIYKNQVIQEQNKSLLVETLRSIAEILIWGDQNDSTVFDFFLEKNMLSFFLKIMKQKCGSYVCVQLLQTLNILFENIRNETSLYYLLSNNHVNSIIVHKFDFSDEEVMAYYISFLKTLSLKLNTHTIHFFYNEHTNDFPLYTEAIKFFNHSESMVRIAVRTLTLNVFRVDDRAMLKFIRDHTAAPYFHNLVWFIGNHVLELDSRVKASDIQIHPKLPDLVAEHLDHLHYLNDILCLRIDTLNDVLTDHLLNCLFVPLYVYSLIQRRRQSFSEDKRHHISSVVSLFLLSQVFLIISHQPLVQQLAHIILNGDMSLFTRNGKGTTLANQQCESHSEPEFVAPKMTLEKSLETTSSQSLAGYSPEPGMSPVAEEGPKPAEQPLDLLTPLVVSDLPSEYVPPSVDVVPSHSLEGENITDEEKVVAAQKISFFESVQDTFSLSNRPFLEAVFSALDCSESDHAALFALCLLYALGHNPGINQDLLDTVLMPSDKSETKLYYNAALVEKLLKIIELSCQYNSKVRLATLEVTILLLKQLAVKDRQSFLQDRHLAAIEQHRDDSSLMLLNFYKSEEIFLDMFEDEYEEMKKRPLNVEYLMMDAKLLLPPTGTPMSGVDFYKRLPCGEVERARRAIRFFFLLRDLSLTLQDIPETQLPLTTNCIKVNDMLDLNNGDLFYCTVVTRDGHKTKQFMVVDAFQLVLVKSEPPKRHGWGVATFVGFLQDTEVTGDKDDSQCLHITVHCPSSKASGSSRTPLLAAKFIFDDNIRCLAAKQCITRGRRKARQKKLHQIARLLDLPDHVQPCPSPLRRGLHRDTDRPSTMHRSMSQDTGLLGQSVLPGCSRPLHHSIFSPKIPGYATKLKQEEIKHSSSSEFRDKPAKSDKKRSPVGSRRSSPKSRDSSPRTSQDGNLEEIPLEDLSKSRGSSRHNSPSIRRKSTSGLPQARISAPPGLCHIHHFSASQSKATTSSEKETKPSHSSKVVENIPLCPENTPAALLVTDSSAISAVLPSTPVILPPVSEGNLASTNNAYCTKPCCAMEPNHEKSKCSNGTSSSANAQSSSLNCQLNSTEEKKSGKVKGAIQTV